MKHVTDVVATLLVDLLDPMELAIVSTWGEQEWRHVMSLVKQQAGRISSMQSLSWDVKTPEQKQREEWERTHKLQVDRAKSEKDFKKRKLLSFGVPLEADSTLTVDEVSIGGYMPADISIHVTAYKSGSIEVPTNVILMCEDDSDVIDWIRNNLSDDDIDGGIDWDFDPGAVDLRNASVNAKEDEFASDDSLDVNEMDFGALLEAALEVYGIDPEEWENYEPA